MLKRRAVFDIGTVTTRMMVADCELEDSDSGSPRTLSVHEVYRATEITELGEGILGTGRLKPEAIGRVASAIDGFSTELAELGLDLSGNDPDDSSVVAIATSAARDASNSQDLVDELRKRNIPLAVISGDKEAAYGFIGAASDFKGCGILVSDIGGGSTELTLGDAPEDGEPTIRLSHSFDVGCRRVTDMFLESDPPLDAEVEAARIWIEGQLSPFFDGGIEVGELIGVAGTVTSLVSMREAMEVYDPSRVHGSVVGISDVDDALEHLSSIPLDERRQVVGLEPKRAPVIVSGMLILQVLMRLAGADELVVSESDNLKGLMLDWPYAV